MPWLAGRAQCRACGHVWAVACKADANVAEMECPACHVHAGEMPRAPECLRCGECCRANGLIPPFLPGDPDDDNAPPWMLALVNSLRRDLGDVAEDFDCLCLLGNECVIHDKPWRPVTCRKFYAGDCPGHREEGE